MNNENAKKLYNALSQDYDMGDYDSFVSDIQDETKRKKLYDVVKEDYDMGDYDSFVNQLGLGAKPTTASVPTINTDVLNKQPIDTIAPVYTPMVEQEQAPTDQTFYPTNEDKFMTTMQISNDVNNFNRGAQAMSEHLDDIVEYHSTTLGGRPKQVGLQLNKETGVTDKVYLTPTGEKTTNKVIADDLSSRFRSSVADTTTNGKIRNASRRLAEVERRLAERGQVLREQYEQNKPTGVSGFLTTMGQQLSADKMGGATPNTYEDEKEFVNDRDYNALLLQKHELENQIQQLQDYKSKEDNGERFWNDFGREAWQVVASTGAWDFGKGAMRDATIKLQLANTDLDKMSEEQQNAMFEQYMTNYVMTEFGDLGMGARLGNMFGTSLSFMKDFYVGGYGSISGKLVGKIPTAIAKRAANKLALDATRSLGVKVAKDGLISTIRTGGKGVLGKVIAEQGLGRTASLVTTRALGVLAEDLIIRAPLMTATVQGQQLAADIINTKLGPIEMTQDGELQYVNDKSWGEAAWEASADKVIENYSEMWGAHIPALADVTKAIGARSLTSALLRSTREGAGTILSKTSELLGKMGVDGIFGEIGEEYYGQALRTALDLESSKDASGRNLLYDKDFHADIICGIGLSVGLTGMVTATGMYGAKKAVEGAEYLELKHNLKKYNAKASELFTPEVWNELRSRIDETQNADMHAIIDAIRKDNSISDEQHNAAMDYIYSTMQLRGHNLREYITKKHDLDTAENDALSESYIDGYNANGKDEVQDIKNTLDMQREKVSAFAEDLLPILDSNPLGAIAEIANNPLYSQEERDTIIDYLNAKQVYDGMIQRVRDDIDSEVTQATAMVNSRTNRSTGVINPATLKNDKQVYIINGNVKTLDDGSGVIDKSATDDTLFVRDAESGKIEQISPDRILTLGQQINPDEEIARVTDEITEKIAQEASDKIDGVATFNVGDTYTMTIGNEQKNIQITPNEVGVVDNGDGTVNVTDGVAIFPMPKDEIQSQYTASNLARIQPQVESVEQPQAEQVEQPQQPITFAKGEIVTLTNANGQPVRATINENKNDDGLYEVETETPINGKRVQLLSEEQLNTMLYPTSQQQTPIEETAIETESTAPVVESVEPGTQQQSAIPTDKDGNPIYANVTPDVAFNDILSQAGGNVEIANNAIASMISDKKAALKKAESAKAKSGKTIAEKIAAENERVSEINKAKEDLAMWESIANVGKSTPVETESMPTAEVESAPVVEEMETTAPVEETAPVVEETEQSGAEEETAPTAEESTPEVVEESAEETPIEETVGVSPNKPSLLDVVRTLYSKGKEVASKLFQRSFFDVAQTPKFMQELGLRGDKFTIKYGVIARHLGKDSSHALTERDWEQLPQALQNPFAISKLTDKDDSYRIYTTLQTEGGEFVVVGADVKNAGREIEVNAISTVFGRRNNANLPKNEEVIYRSKEITPEQSSLLERPNFAQYPTEQELSEGKDTTSSPITNELEEKSVVPSIGEQVQAAEAEVNVNPTDKQKEAGNYKKGHVQIGTFNVTIEQPKGSVRSGVDAKGNKWETEMQNTYGYIRGTEGVDGDHIDVFLSNDIDGWNGRQVFVVDQYNEDGSFDEHKVMLGFNDINEAEEAYLSNYGQGWQGLGAITGIAIEDFEKWIASSHRKTKAFAEYKSVKTTEGQSASADLDKRQNLANFNVGDVVRDYYDHKLYRIKKHSTNGVSTIAELDAEGNEVRTTTMNAHNNSRYSIAETPTISQDTDQVSDQVSDQDATDRVGIDEDIAKEQVNPYQHYIDRLKEWEEKTGVEVVVYTNPRQVRNQKARKFINDGKIVKGWYSHNTKKVYIYLPHIESTKDLDETFIHEVVSHKGLRQLLGEEAYDELCINVFNGVMNERQQYEWLAYNGVALYDKNGNRVELTPKQMILAADEFIAAIAERLDVESTTVWQNIVGIIREFLAKHGLIIGDINENELNSLLRRSFKNLNASKKKDATITETEIKVEEDGTISFSLATANNWIDNLGNKHTGTMTMVLERMKKMNFSIAEIEDMKNRMQTMYDYMDKLAEMTDLNGNVRFNEFVKWAKKIPLYKQVGESYIKAITSLVSNGDYPVNLELTTDCIKREAFTQLLNTLVQRGADLSKMGPSQIVTIQNIMKQYGIEVACKLCFVEGKRLQIVNWASQIVEDWNDALVEAGFNTDEYFNFGKDGEQFIPAEEWRTFEDKPKLQRAMVAIDEAELAFSGIDPITIKRQKATNKRRYEAYKKEKADAWAKKTKRSAELWKPNDEQKAEMEKILREGLTPTYVNDNMKEYRDAINKMRQEWIEKYPKKDALMFTPTAKQWSELEKIRNHQIKLVKQKMVRLIMEYPEMRKKMTLNDLLGSNGLMEIRQQHGKAYDDLFSIILQRFGTGTPKPIQDAVPYDGEVMSLSQSKFAKANKIGGARLFSFSDFDITKVFDYMQMFFDLEANKQMLQSYTKEVAAVLLFGRSNAKFNISTLANAYVPEEVKQAYKVANEAEKQKLRHEWAENAGLIVDANGQIIGINFSQEHSVSPDFAKAIFHDDSRNKDCGAIMVGASVNHAIFSAAQDWIRMVIPFHLSGMPIAAREKTDVLWYTDNTPFQSTRKKSDDGWSKISSAEDTFSFYDDMGNEGWNMRDKAKQYLEWCRSNGYRPKFDWGINSDYYRAYCIENGYTPNEQIIEMMDADTTDGVWNQYYKFLTDFTAYKPVFNSDGQMVDEIPSPQKPVRANFTLNETERKVLFEGENSMLAHREDNIRLAEEHMQEIADKVIPYLNGEVSEEDLNLNEDIFYDSHADANLYLDEMGEDVSFRYEELNNEFNEELEQQIEGTLPSGHIYQLGLPGSILKACGFPNLPIQLGALNLEKHANNEGHKFELKDVKDLVKSLLKPIAVFSYGDKGKSQNVIIETQRNGKNFLVGIHFNQKRGDLEVSSIRGIFPKDSAEWLNWISQGKHIYLDKEKIQDLIDKQRTTLADVEYLDLDSIAKIINEYENPNNFSNIFSTYAENNGEYDEENEDIRFRYEDVDEDEEINFRHGDGVYTDDEVSLANDPVSKALGKSIRTRKEREEFAQRERRRMIADVQALAEKLNLDNVEIVTDETTLQGNQRIARGFFNKNTGKITIVIPNHYSAMDAEATLMHEAVAHYGLRQLFGEHFDTFLDNVFNNAEKDVREKIVNLAARKGWNFRLATEEYLASLAEEVNFRNLTSSWWDKIKDYFVSMLEQLGIKGFNAVTISDNDLRYILYRSYLNLRNRDVFVEAEDIAKQYELGVGNFKVANTDTAEDDEVNFRMSDHEMYERALARDAYERKVKSGWYQTQEAQQDSMLGLKEAMQAILGKKVYMEDIAGFENAYLGENRLASKNKAEIDAFAALVFKPMLVEVAKLAKTEDERTELTDYLMAKHGLERNEYMAKQAAEEYIQSQVSELQKELNRASTTPERAEVINESIERLNAELEGIGNTLSADDAQSWYNRRLNAINTLFRNGNITEEEYNKRLHKINLLYSGGWLAVFRERDYAGLTALTETENVADAEEAARQMVADYEAKNDTENLWNAIRNVSDTILNKSFDSGLMSKEVYDKVRAMYKYYIPLRGFDEETSAEAYAYLGSQNDAFNAPIRKTKGRDSKADDPFANLASMMESAVLQGNRNKLVKQKFLNFVLNHPSDLVSVNELWIEYDAAAEEWKPVFPTTISESDTPQEVEQKMADFEKRMTELAEQEPERYKKGKDAVNIPYRVVKKNDLHQHQVIVKKNGKDVVLTVNGSPRLAQALNGLTNPNNDITGMLKKVFRSADWVNRQLSAAYTTRNPGFVVSNFLRDMLYTNTMVWIKESPKYAMRFHINYGKFNPVYMRVLYHKYQNGTLDMNGKFEKMFYQFMMNGGEAGYVNLRDIEQHKNEITEELKKANGQNLAKRGWELFTNQLDALNRSVENCARFAAFVTSREFGRDIERSIYDAKEISVNFNKKGSGGKFAGAVGQTRLGNIMADTSGWGRVLHVFWNPAIQGTTNFGRQAKRHPKKALTAMASMFMLGALAAYLGDDDEEDAIKNSYYDLPEHVRRTNLLVRAGDHFISMPLPVEYRAVYGMGELMMSTILGKEQKSSGELAEAIAAQMTQIFPIDMLEGDGGLDVFVPSGFKPVWEVYENKSWTGLPIYKDNDFNKNKPNWTKAYKSTNKHLVNLASALNEWSGGDKHTKGVIDINPARAEHLLEGYLGGPFTTVDKLTKMGETWFGDREYDPRSFLLWDRVVKSGDERTEARHINNEYFRMKDEFSQLKERFNAYKKDTRYGLEDFTDKMKDISNSKDYKRMHMFFEHDKTINKLNQMLKQTDNEDQKKLIQQNIDKAKYDLVKTIKETYKESK